MNAVCVSQLIPARRHTGKYNVYAPNYVKTMTAIRGSSNANRRHTGAQLLLKTKYCRCVCTMHSKGQVRVTSNEQQYV